MNNFKEDEVVVGRREKEGEKWSGGGEKEKGSKMSNGGEKRESDGGGGGRWD